MGLFSNKKKLCPICESPTPRLFPTVVDGMPICKECKKKINLPDGALDAMSLEDFRQYMAYHQENAALRDTFEPSFSWNSVIDLDPPKRLFRLGGGDQGLVLEAACLRAFRILEDDKVLFENGPDGLLCYENDILTRAEALAPAISQFNILMEQYRQVEQMKEMRKNDPNGDSAPSLPYVSRPYFDQQLIHQGFKLELTMEHPYWDGVHSWIGDAPKFDDSSPSVASFMRKYDKAAEALHTLAVSLMELLCPGAPEIKVSSGIPAGGEAARAVPVTDPVEEIKKYKALLDSGIITDEEFSAKKRQILGI